jgi:CPA2 family monovalent cation:H+ antiporter-2
MNVESLISDLAFILLLGAFVTVLFKWIKQPVVLGYIVAGFLASPHFMYLPSVTSEENIDFWAQIGIIVLLFSLGLEFSFKKLINTGASAVVTALIIVLGMMGVGFCLGHLMGFTSINSLFLGGMLSMSSTTIIIKAFTDLGLRQKKFASLVLAVLIVEDLFAVLMMVILSSIATSNGVGGSALFFSIAKLIFFLVIWFLVGIFMLPSAFNRCRRFLNQETLLIVSMGLCLGMAVFSVYCGFSLALGAFVMGSILAGTSYAERIEHVVTPIKDLFGAVFFISVGMMVQPSIVADYWGSILILSCTVIVGMIVFGTSGMLVTGQTLKVAIQSGFSLTQIGEFAFIIATLGMSLGVLEANIYPIVVAVSVLTTFTTPYFIKLSTPFYNFVERHLPQNLRFLIDRYQTEASKEQVNDNIWSNALRRYGWRTLIYSIVLVAVSIISTTYLLPALQTIMPNWYKLVTMLITLGVMSPFLVAMLLPFARLLTAPRSKKQVPLDIAVISISILNFVISLYFVFNVISHAYSMRWGVGIALAALLLVMLLFSRRVRHQMTNIESRFMHNLNERDLRRSGKNTNLVNDLHLAYITVGSGCEFIGERLKNSNVRSKYGVNIVSIQRAQRLITVPGGEARIFPGDIIGVVGTDEQIENILPIVERECEVDPTEPGTQHIKLTGVRLSAGSILVGKTPRTSGLLDYYDSLLLAVQRNDEYIDHTPDLEFAAGDVLWLVGDEKTLAQLK